MGVGVMLDIQNGTERDDLGVVKGITLLPSVLQARLTGRRGGRSFVVDFGGRFCAFRWILFALFRISEPESSSLPPPRRRSVFLRYWSAISPRLQTPYARKEDFF